MNHYQLAWAGLIFYSMIMYVVLDGFTLGIGIILPFLNEHDADIAMSVILPTWDGNQTWLVMGLACLYGAFPLAFSLLMPALYLPIFVMGIALLFRGVVFEFRLKSTSGKYRWSVLFGLSSLICTFIQGLILGTFIHGFKVNSINSTLVDVHYFTHFSLFIAISLIVGYLLLGTTRMILKTSGALCAKMYRAVPVFALLLAICLLVVSIWTPFISPYIESRWFNLALWPYLVVMPAIMMIAFLVLIVALIKKVDSVP